MKKIILLLLSILLCFNALCQNNKANKNTIKHIKESNLYFWGESGASRTPKDGKDKALNNLINNIKENHNGHAWLFQDVKNEQLEEIYRSFEDDIMQQPYIICSNSKENNFFRYMAKTEFDSLCQRRTELIMTQIHNGKVSEMKKSLGDALKSYYTALLLCYSHPDGKLLKFDPDKSDNVNKEIEIISWLNNKIDGDDGILKSINIKVKSWEIVDDHCEVVIAVYCDVALSNMRILYYDPTLQNDVVCNIENGTAKLIFDKNINESYVKIDFSYPDLQSNNPAAFNMNETVGNQILFHKATYKIKKPKKNNNNAVKPQNSDPVISNAEDAAIVSDDEKNEYDKIMKDVENVLVNHKNLSTLSEYFTPECLSYFQKIMNCDNYSILGENLQFSYINHGDEVICHSIPVQYQYGNNTKFSRSLSFRFTKSTGKISSVAYRISESAESDILNKTQWDASARLTLIDFLEDFQTAYMAKNIDYLRNIYSDDALIIVGHKLEKKVIDDNTGLMSDQYEYTQLSKEKYLTNLENLFRNKKYVNIRFTDVNVEESYSEKNVFGINVAQHFSTNTYVDNGYLFLYVDLRGENPIIYIRTWQPEKTTVEEQFTLRKLN